MILGVLYGMMIAHFISYKDYYLRMITTYGITYIMKKLVKAAGDNDNAGLVGLGGNALVGAEFVKLMGAINKAAHSSHGGAAETEKFIGGWVGDAFEFIKKYFE